MLFPASGVEMSAAVPLIAGFAVSLIGSLVGVSGAFLLVPFQMSVLGIAGAVVSATSLAFNLFSTPGAVWRFVRDRRLDWHLSAVVIAGTTPGLFAGWWLRVHWLADARDFKAFVGIVLALLAARLLAPATYMPVREAAKAPYGLVMGLSLLVGVLGGAYGIGGGALPAPIFVAVLGLPITSVAGATLLATFITSAIGVWIFSTLVGPDGDVVRPDWAMGALFGLGGLLGSYIGASIQQRFPERVLRLTLATLILGVAVLYLIQGVLI